MYLQGCTCLQKRGFPLVSRWHGGQHSLQSLGGCASRQLRWTPPWPAAWPGPCATPQATCKHACSLAEGWPVV